MRCSVRVLRKTLPAETPLAMVGYSMGAIVASNYAAISGKNSGLSCVVSMSGSFDSRYYCSAVLINKKIAKHGKCMDEPDEYQFLHEVPSVAVLVSSAHELSFARVLIWHFQK